MKQQKIKVMFKCNNCKYVWNSKSVLIKPTCPSCKGSNTEEVKEE